ncbi:hypothetical protein [Actinosynnema pretiosum]|uniref:Uncharacterized protein n=1 Tax=Actinosynnema pretiosum TaxID=42197 RepID=A0A290Z7G1_9PSEU|nr:hypothetical protein [Actinosynnema pretiosum]ATE54936.1 hypothetical protein CNX65_17960 [Actinosynnema pretiosum]
MLTETNASALKDVRSGVLLASASRRGEFRAQQLPTGDETGDQRVDQLSEERTAPASALTLPHGSRSR